VRVEGERRGSGRAWRSGEAVLFALCIYVVPLCIALSRGMILGAVLLLRRMVCMHRRYGVLDIQQLTGAAWMVVIQIMRVYMGKINSRYD
jgi:hypothetical protein